MVFACDGRGLDFHLESESQENFNGLICHAKNPPFLEKNTNLTMSQCNSVVDLGSIATQISRHAFSTNMYPEFSFTRRLSLVARALAFVLNPGRDKQSAECHKSRDHDRYRPRVENTQHEPIDYR